ncbi:MAG: hypothetical protein H6739_10775 [Alphaproteobacteria bacterium]|nr:hypothetical protein [Alphaproteobacteria bacterium]
MTTRTLFAMALAMALACAGGKDDTGEPDDTSGGGTPQLDVLFVLDNSSSMSDSSQGVAELARDLIAALDADGVDYRVGLTTSDVEVLGGQLLTGALSPEQLPALAMTEAVYCEATCWNVNSLPSVPSYTCGDPITQVSVEVLDCVCGVEAWEGRCGSGNEEMLEAAWLDACTGAGGTLADCSDGTLGFNGATSGLGRTGVPLVVFMITDEGDYSRRLNQGEDDPSLYLSLFSDAGVEPIFVVVGPDYDRDNNSLACNSGGGTPWGISRLLTAADTTGGAYAPIEADDGSGCANQDFSSLAQTIAGYAE